MASAASALLRASGSLSLCDASVPQPQLV